MFEKKEAFDFILNFLEVENAESRMESSKKALLDEILFNLCGSLPFHNATLLSMPVEERRKPTLDEMKTNYTSGRGGLCCDLNIPTFYLLSAIGFDVHLLYCTVSSAAPRNHALMIARNVEQEGDSFLVDVGVAHPTFRTINLDFERESPIYVDSYLEYKFVKLDKDSNNISRMHKKGDPKVSMALKEDSEADFWTAADGWRWFYTIEIDSETKDPSKFEEYHEIVYTNPTATPFHLSHRVLVFPKGKAVMVVNGKTYTDIDGELVIKEIEGGDEAIFAKIKEICPRLPDELISKSLLHWRQSQSAASSEKIVAA